MSRFLAYGTLWAIVAAASHMSDSLFFVGFVLIVFLVPTPKSKGAR
jgi:hypothetical protein